MCHWFTLTFIQSFIIKLQKAKYNKLLTVTKNGNMVKPGMPNDNIKLARIISAIIATSKFLPIGCL